MTLAAASLFPLPVEQVRTRLPHSVRAAILSGRELAREARTEEREPLPTSVACLDQLLSGGLPRGHLVELIGGRSSGRFSTVLQILAAATSAGEDSALIDLGDGLDPVAALRVGADLSRLLWLRPVKLAAALAAAEMVIGCGLPLVVIDLGVALLSGGGQRHEAAWLRLARTARQRGCALLIASPYRVSGTAASAVLRTSRVRPLWEALRSSRPAQKALPLLAGASSSLWLEKHRKHSPTVALRHPLTWGEHESLATLTPQAPSPIPATWDQEASELPARRRSAGQ
jgi:hypothetical protein